MKVVRTGTRVSAFASLLLAGACMAGGNTADKAELGVDPADGTSGGGGGGGVGSGNIDARFAVTKLTADQAGVAINTDPQLQDVWGVTSLQDQFFAVAQATGQVIGLAPGGEPTMHIRLLEETAPAGTVADMTGTGIAVLSETDNILMDIAGNCDAASLLVAAQSGRLWAVNPDISQDKAFVVADRSAAGAQYTGVVVLPPQAVMTTGGDDGHGGGGGGTPPPAPAPTARVLAVDFHNGRVDAFDVMNGILEFDATASKQFVIPNLPTNFAPFGIFATGNRVVLTAAERRTNGAGEPDIDQQAPGDGKGIVAAFDLTGKLVWRTQSSMFNIPWGMAMGDLRLCATSALLVGQHGDATKTDGANNKFGGTIIAMDLRTGKVIQPLLATDTQPVRVQGLWGLTFAPGITSIQETRLHLGAGPVVPNGTEPVVEHGLFARLEMTSL